jgi:MoaA/NifB/PqqE/SkfB family radical SAM enzyme
MMNLEFATAVVHNSFYFHKYDNKFEKPEVAIEELKKVISEMLKSPKIKDWFRAYFNYGLINYIKGKPRLLPCQMGHDSFFLDPYGEILPCNVMEESMGNLTQMSFQDIWNGPAAERARELVRKCGKNCWMIGSVGQQMKKYISRPSQWIIKHKFLKNELGI